MQVVRPLIFEFVSILFELLVGYFLFKTIIIADKNRDLIIDTNRVLNETEVIDNGVEKIVDKDDEIESSFKTQEFNKLIDDCFCECGWQLYKSDKSCPNCGKKIERDKE